MQHEPIRILQVTTTMNFGGLETLLMNYYRKIDRSRVQFDFLIHRRESQDFEQEILSLGGKIYRLPPLNPLSHRYWRALRSFMECHSEYRIVHSHLNCTAGIPLKVAKQFSVPVCIAHSHTSNQNRNLKYPVKLFCRKFIPKHATQLFACSNAAGDWMFRGAPYTIMRNAIDAEKFSFCPQKAAEMKAALGLQGKYVLGHVGSFRFEKNHSFLIRLFRRIHINEPNSVLLLVGKGSEMDAVQSLVKELGLIDAVHFLGSRSDIPALMQAMDVFLLPSLHEGLPVTMVEAQAADLPCVISDRVPAECKFTDNVHFVSLDAPISEWEDLILSYRNYQRKDTLPILRNSGYDITSNAQWLQTFYLNNFYFPPPQLKKQRSD